MGDVLKSRADDETPYVSHYYYHYHHHHHRCSNGELWELTFLEDRGAVDFEDCLVSIFVLFRVAHGKRLKGGDGGGWWWGVVGSGGE